MTYVHILLAREDGLAGRVQQHQALHQVQRAEDQQIVRSVAALGKEPVEGADEPRSHVPLESLLQLEELAERRIPGQVRQVLFRRQPDRVAILLVDVYPVAVGPVCL